MNCFKWNTPYKDLSETLQKILDAEDKMFSVKKNGVNGIMEMLLLAIK